MRKRLLAVGCTMALAAGFSASSALADPPTPASAPFVCPVMTINENAVEQTGKFTEIGEGQYTFGPGNAGSADTFNGNVPNIATNADGDGSPGGDHSAPGDRNYTAIWSGNQQ